MADHSDGIEVRVGSVSIVATPHRCQAAQTLATGLSESRVFRLTVSVLCVGWKGAISGRALAPQRHARSFLDCEAEA